MRTITEEKNNSKQFRMLAVAVVALIYVLSPVDVLPGIAVDDIAAIIIAILRVKKLAE